MHIYWRIILNSQIPSKPIKVQQCLRAIRYGKLVKRLTLDFSLGDTLGLYGTEVFQAVARAHASSPLFLKLSYLMIDDDLQHVEHLNYLNWLLRPKIRTM